MNHLDITAQLSFIEELCNKYEYENANEMLAKLASMIQEYDNVVDVHKFHLLSGICDYEKHKFVSAIDHFSKCLNLIDDNNILLLKHNALHELSLCYLALFRQNKKSSDLQLSIDYCSQALNECIDYSLTKKSTGFMEYYIESPEHYLSELVHLATLFQAKKDFDKSGAILEIAMTCCKRHYKWRTLGVVYDELGSNHRCLGEIEKALYYYGKAMKVKSFIGNKRGLDVTMDNIIICLVQEKLKEYDSDKKPDELNLRHILEEESL